MTPPTEESASSVPLPPAAPKEVEASFSYKGWQVLLQLDGKTREGCVAAHAEIHAGNYTCRLMLASPHYDGDGAMTALAKRARDLIDDRQALAAEIHRT